MRALYVTGATSMTDVRPAQRLTQVAPDLAMTYVPTVADALVEVRKTSGYQVLFTDPSLPQNETLALITSLRRDRVPLALVPVVSEDQRDFLASAVAAGADDVLLLQGETVLHAAGTLLRIRHSPHLLPAENRPRLRLLYAGKDQLVWTLLEQIPFIKSERAMLGADGSCVVRIPGADTGRLRCDVVLIDEQPGDAHPLQVVKSVKSQASDVPVVVLTAANDLHTATAALDLGADEAVSKAGIYRRRLIATLRRLHQRVEMEALHSNVAARETRLRNIVERLPAAVAVISDDGRILAVNNTALALLSAQQPSDLVGREFRSPVVESDQPPVEQTFESIRRGQDATIRAALLNGSAAGHGVELRGVLLEKDARGGRGVVIVMSPVDAPVAAVIDGAPAAGFDPAELDATRAEAAEAASRAETMQTRFEDARAAHDQALHEAGRQRAEWDAERRAFENQLAELRDAQAAIDDMRAAAERDQQRDVAAAAQALAGWHDERAAFEARLADFEAVERDVAALRDAHTQAAAREQSLVDELTAARAAAADEISAIRAAAAEEVTAARSEAEREREDWAQTRAALERQGDEGHRERDAWLEERGELRAHIVDLEREISELAALRGMLDAARHQEQRLAGDLSMAHEAVGRERDAAGQARASADEARARADAAEHALQQAQSEFTQRLAAAEMAYGRSREDWDAERARMASELAQAAEALASQRAEHEAQAHASQGELVSGGRFGAVVATRAGVVVRANDSFGRLLGYGDAYNLTSYMGGRPIAGLALRGFDETRDTTGAPVRVSFSLDRREGGTIHGVGAVRRLDEWRDGEPLFEHMVLSVSRELDLEDRLRQARRLEAVGTLATAMVPELESLIAQWMRGGAEMQDAQQAAEVIGQLAAFSRHQSFATGWVDLSDVVRRLQSLLEQLAGPQHQVRVDLRRAPVSDVAETELAQLVTALVVMGRDLLPAGGAIEVATIMDDEMGTYASTDAAPVRRPRHARLRVSLRGYGLRAYSASETLDALVARCSGTLHAEPTGPRSLSVTVELPGAR